MHNNLAPGTTNADVDHEPSAECFAAAIAADLRLSIATTTNHINDLIGELQDALGEGNATEIEQLAALIVTHAQVLDKAQQLLDVAEDAAGDMA